MRRFRYPLVGCVALALAAPVLAGSTADVGVLKTGPDTAAPDTDVAYAITVTNAGPDDASSVELTDDVPAGMSFVSANQDSGPAFTCSFANPTITCSIATLPSGATATFTFTMHIGAGATPGTFFLNRASVSSETFDPNDKNDSGVAGTTVPQPSADFSLQKTGPGAATPDSDVTYTITVTNAGPDTAGATWDDTLPAPMTFVALNPSAGCTTGATVTCTLAAVAPGTSLVYTLTGHIPPGTSAGTEFTNQATVEGDVEDPNPNNDTGITGLTVSNADVSVTKSGPAAVTAGQTATYTITVMNVGPDVASAVNLNDALPAPMTVASFTQDTGPAPTCAVGVTSVGCTWPTLASSATATFTLVANVNGPADGASLTNTATVTSESGDPNLANNGSSTTAAAAAVADVGVTKTGPAAAVGGQNIAFTLGISNSGPSPADGVTLTDVLPATATFVALNQNTGPAFGCTTPAVGSTGTVTCTLASLAAGDAATFTLTVRTDPAFDGTLSNTASGATSTTDSGGGNDAATAAVTVTAGPAPPSVIPTLNGAMLLLLGAGLAAAALIRLRR